MQIKTKVIETTKGNLLVVGGLPKDAVFEGYPSPNSVEFMDSKDKSYYIEVEEDSELPF